MITKPKAEFGDVRTFGINLSVTKGIGLLIDIELWRYEFRWAFKTSRILHVAK